jgi:hypothetical protein
VDRLDGRCVDCLVHVQRNRLAVPKVVTAQVEKEQQMSIEITEEMVDLACRMYEGNSKEYAVPEYMRAALTAVAPLMQAKVAEGKDAEIARLNAIINTPQADDFLRAVSIEAEHQRQRWGTYHDGGKEPADWFWLVGYLAGKALHAHVSGDTAKAEHHVITTAAACANWHRGLFGLTDMRPGTAAPEVQS